MPPAREGLRRPVSSLIAAFKQQQVVEHRRVTNSTQPTAPRPAVSNRVVSSGIVGAPGKCAWQPEDGQGDGRATLHYPRLA